MIPGLKKRHIGISALFLLIFTMTATADNTFSLNWEVVTGSFNSLVEGSKGLLKAQGELAKQLDSETAKRYGVSQDEKRLSSCVTTPVQTQITQVSDSDVSEVYNNTPKTRQELVRKIGLPVCQDVSGSEIWFRENGDKLNVNYSKNEDGTLVPKEMQSVDPNKENNQE